MAVKELLSTEQTGCTIDKPKRAQEFIELFDVPTFQIPDGYFTEKRGKSYESLFDHHCTRVLSGFAMRWNPTGKCKKEYLDEFSRKLRRKNIL